MNTKNYRFSVDGAELVVQASDDKGAWDSIRMHCIALYRQGWKGSHSVRFVGEIY
jgi:hypothetical protein